MGGAAMPGILRGEDVDTSSWGVKEWQAERLWGICFLGIWTAIFALMVFEDYRCPAWWPQRIFIWALGGWGIISQVISLIRITMWLRKQRTELKA
jgi:hypothetical protein